MNREKQVILLGHTLSYELSTVFPMEYDSDGYVSNIDELVSNLESEKVISIAQDVIDAPMYPCHKHFGIKTDEVIDVERKRLKGTNVRIHSAILNRAERDAQYNALISATEQLMDG